MIGKLTGRIDELGEGHVILDVNGVGYLVFASARTLSRLGERGTGAGLLIETHVREDHIHLYGFADAAERAWFRLLNTVQGVGSRVALSILSVLSPSELTQAIAAQDRKTLNRASGVGPKLAQRLVTELKDKVGNIALGMGAWQSGTDAPPAAAGLGTASLGKAAEDAVSALEGLGYRRVEAFQAVAEATRALGADASLEAL
ncbi:MAG TPA: Holliday junction branch migration protein RuvA, partial [Kiloniellales bacterium]|nr:Holliday junction branch migration protein RuvA [Kiloniellales bacterium]